VRAFLRSKVSTPRNKSSRSRMTDTKRIPLWDSFREKDI
jgi:hypothetical protein